MRHYEMLYTIFDYIMLARCCHAFCLFPLSFCVNHIFGFLTPACSVQSTRCYRPQKKGVPEWYTLLKHGVLQLYLSTTLYVRW